MFREFLIISENAFEAIRHQVENQKRELIYIFRFFI